MGSSSLNHDKVNPGPENTTYDKERHEKMRLRYPSYGNRFFTHGSRESKPVCKTCDLLKVWCTCNDAKN